MGQRETEIGQGAQRGRLELGASGDRHMSKGEEAAGSQDWGETYIG